MATSTAPAPRSFNVVGHSVDKLDGISLATGRARFVADWPLERPLVGVALRSPHAHARITRIDASAARELPGVHAVLTWEDVPRVPFTTAGQGFPEPSPYDTFILDKKVRFVGDAVALVAAESAAQAAAALAKIAVDYQVLPAVLDSRRALDQGAPVIHDEPEAQMPIPVEYDPRRNLASAAGMQVGDVDAALARAELTLTREYETHYAQHCPIEPHVTLAYLDEHGRLTIVTSTQVPFHARRIVARALELPVKRVRVIKPRIGGGFGAKQEVLLEPLCAALALACGKPVRMELSRAEEFMASRTRHPIITRMQSAVGRDGKLLATRMEVLSNTGAYGSHALTVAMNCGSKTLPLYHAPNVAFRCQTVYTNLPVAGAYRGYGGTQASYAQEMQMDELAEMVGMDPLEFRLKNAIQSGEGSPVFRALGEGTEGVEQTIGSCGLRRCLELGAEAIGWRAKRGQPGAGVRRRGVGVAALMQGSSIPEVDMAAVTIKINEDGSFNLLAGATDLGTGSDTVLAQIAAEVLGVEASDMIVLSSDTDLTPFDVGAYASSTTYLSGEASRRAAVQVAEQIKAVAAAMLSVPAAEIQLRGGRAVGPGGKGVTLSEVALRALYQRDQHQIAATASAISHQSPPPFSAHFAEVEVDTETGQVTVLHYVAAIDCGTAINPTLAEGQNDGAVVNGISFALTEEYLFDDHGRMLNPNFGHYKIFSTADLPRVQTILVPTYEESGPYGAKSVSEIGINGACPAIANAIYDAIGVRLRSTPFTPERVLAALRGRQG